MNIRYDKKAVPTFNKLYKLPLGSITARGWLKEQLERSAAGMGGNLDKLEPDMIANPFVSKSRETGWNEKLQAGWSTEVSGVYWTGLVQLAFTLGDEALIEKARGWVNAAIANQNTDGYFGGYTENDNKMEDFCAWAPTGGFARCFPITMRRARLTSWKRRVARCFGS